ncbi:MAG: hypothetical protein AAF939_13905 [Planctomycetota bacterium]
MSYFGTIEPRSKTSLGFPVGGKLTRLPQQTNYQSNEILAELDHTNILDQRQSALDQLDQIPDTPEQSERRSRLQDSISELDRQIELRKISAPFDCIIEKVQGSLNGFVAAQRPFISVIERGKPVVRLKIPTRFSKLLDSSGSYIFVMNDLAIEGKLKEKSPVETLPGTVTLEFEIVTELDESQFVFGQSVEARFSIPTEKPGYWIPLTAVQDAGSGLFSILLANPNDDVYRVEKRLVDIAETREDFVFVISDLKGQLVIKDGTHRVVPGQKVQINLQESKTGLAPVINPE